MVTVHVKLLMRRYTVETEKSFRFCRHGRMLFFKQEGVCVTMFVVNCDSEAYGMKEVSGAGEPPRC